MKELQVLEKALDKANSQGVFKTIQESKYIADCFISVVKTIQEFENREESKKELVEESESSE